MAKIKMIFRYPGFIEGKVHVPKLGEAMASRAGVLLARTDTWWALRAGVAAIISTLKGPGFNVVRVPDPASSIQHLH